MSSPRRERPNILFFMSDEHRADVAGYAGNRVVRTPTLDWLAETGVVFRNAYTPSPICVPGRQAMMAGQFPRTCGCERYGQDLPPFSMTFARRLAQYAYVTVCCGKLHHTGPDYLQGWTDRIGSDWTYTERRVEGRDEASYARWRQKPAGFKWSDAKECLKAGPAVGKYQVADEYAVRGAKDFLHQFYADAVYDRSTPQWPLLLKVSLVQPHYPYFCAPEKLAYYLNRVEPFIEPETFPHPFLSQRQVKPGVDASEADLRRATAAYYGMVEQIDTHYADVLNHLRHVGQDLDDWIIVYTSDHGEMLGEHGVWEKQKFFEGSARVPLIIRWPRRFAPRVVDQNVNLCDLFATLCDLAGVPLPPAEETVGGRGLDSRSLVPLMAGDALGWDDETVSQFGGTNLMIKRGSLKYQFYDRDDCRAPEHAEVLFDLAEDPGERRNAIADPRYADAVAAFRKRRAELGFAST